MGMFGFEGLDEGKISMTVNLYNYNIYEYLDEEIIISIPDKYKEIDKNTNLYEERNYSINYNNELDVYDYDINYTLSSSYSKLENLVNTFNNSITKAYGDYKELTFLEEKTISGSQYFVMELSNDGGNVLLGITKANSMYVFIVSLCTIDNEFDYTTLGSINSILANAKYTSASSSISNFERVNIAGVTSGLAQ